MKRVSFITLGCKVNHYDTQAMQKAFAERGFEIVPEGTPADAVIVNTCTVTSEADRKSRQMLRRAVRSYPKALIVASGCFSQGNPEAASSIEGIGIVSGATNRLEVVEYVSGALETNGEHILKPNICDLTLTDEYEELKAEGADGMSRAYLKIEDGCDSFCSYCFVPYVRGRVRSRSIASIEEEAYRLAAAGFKEVILTGIHLGCYGKDFGGKPGLKEAIVAACKPDGIRRVRLSSLEPAELTDEIIELFAHEPKLARHLHLPLQSGDDTILAAMNRSYDAGHFRKVVAMARERIGDLGLTTDIIVGFPGETEAMFQNTLRLVRDVEFQQAHIFPYSRRAGTLSASMPGQIPDDVKRKRAKELAEVAASLNEARILSMMDRIVEVIIEKEMSNTSGGYEYEGYSSEYVKVGFSSQKRVDGFAKVRICGIGQEGARALLVE